MAPADTRLAAFTGKRILITGGAGFLASNLVARLSSVDCCVVRITRTDAPATANVPGRVQCKHLAGDISAREFWEGALPATDFLFHFAAQTSVYTADEHPAADWQANVLPMLSLLEVCREKGHRPIILFSGTVTQFGLPEHLPVDESQPDRPVTIYDHHKIAAEAYLEHYVRQGWARGANLRLANIYGPGPASGKPDRGVLNLMMRRALKGEALPLYGVGHQMRDYLFVTDAVDAFLAAAAHADAVNGRHFVLASGEGHTLAQTFHLVAERAALLTGNQVAVTHVPPPAGLSRIEDRSFVGDISQLSAATGWEPSTKLVAGLDMSLKSFADCAV